MTNFILTNIGGKRRDRERDRDREDRDRRPRKSGPQPDDVCFNCRGTGHW